MKIFRILCVLSISLLIGSCGGNVWRDMAKKDLDFVYTTLKDNHPGSVDPGHP